MTNLKKKLHDQSRSLRKMFRKFDTDHSQTISFPEFRSMLDYYGMGVTQHEALTLFRSFDKSGTGMISYEAFCEAFSEDGTPSLKSEERVRQDLERGRAMDADERDAYQRMAEQAAEQQEKRSYVSQLMATIARSIRNSKTAALLYQKFREFDVNKDHTVDRAEFRMAMGDGKQLGKKQALSQYSTALQVRVTCLIRVSY